MAKNSKTKSLKSDPKLSRFGVVLFGVVFAAVGAAVLFVSLAASSASLYLKPASQTMSLGASFSVQMRYSKTYNSANDKISTGLTFPASKLSISSIVLAGYPFYFGSQSFDNNAGTASIENDAFGSSSPGDYLVATINFTAKAGGSAAVNFSNTTITYGGGGTQVTPILSGANYTITSPPPPPPPRPNPPPSPRPNPTPTPTAPPSGSASPPPPSGSGIGSSATTDDTTTYPIVLSVKAGDGSPKVAIVTINGITQQTGDDGTASYNLSAGKASASIKVGSAVYQYDFTVQAESPQSDGQLEPQAFTFNLPAAAAKAGQGSAKTAVAIGAALAAATGLLLVIAGRTKRRGPKKPKPPKPPKVEAPPLTAQPIPRMPPPIPEPIAAPPPPPVQHHLTPPPHGTRYPWVVGEAGAKPRRTVSSSIAAGEDYVEPEDMFSQGQKRLDQEGLGKPKK